MCVVIRAFDSECVDAGACVSFIDQQMKAVSVMRSRGPDGLMGNTNFLFIYTAWLNAICFCLARVGLCVVVCVRLCVSWYLWTNKMNGSEQSGFHDDCGNQGRAIDSKIPIRESTQCVHKNMLRQE